MKARFILCAVVVVILSAVSPLSSALVIYSAQSSFNTQVATDGLSLVGTEDFESSTLADNMTSLISDPLMPGVANGPFTSGALASPGIRIQSNTNIDGGASLSVRGGNSLFTNSDGYRGGTSDIVGTAVGTDSLDILMPFGLGAGVRAVSLHPLFVGFINGIGFPTLNTSLDIKVFDTTNLLIGSFQFTTNNTNTNFLGLVTTGGENIGRINIDNFTFDDDMSLAVDNISVFTTSSVPPVVMPEPGFMLLTALLAMFICLRNKL